jgi:nitrogen fixation protein NifB
VNTVLIPGINDQHILEIAKKVKELGAYTQNIMPLIPQHRLAHVSPPTQEQRKKIQDECSKIICQMRHCRQCRADACGKLGGDDRHGE